MTDWCISAFTFSCIRRLPSWTISVAMCERRSNVTGSTVWYSSSIPMVKDGSLISQGSIEDLLEQRAPAGRSLLFLWHQGLFHRHVGHGVDDPLEVGRPDGSELGIG